MPTGYGTPSEKHTGSEYGGGSLRGRVRQATGVATRRGFLSPLTDGSPTVSESPALWGRGSRGEDGLCKLGFSRFFLLVDDDKAAPPPANANPRALHDGALARYQLKRWRILPVKDDVTGEMERGPEKRNDDFGNGLMMCVHDGLPLAVSLDFEGKLKAASPALAALAERIEQGGATTGDEMGYWYAREQAKKLLGYGRSQEVDEWGQTVEPVNW